MRGRRPVRPSCTGLAAVRAEGGAVREAQQVQSSLEEACTRTGSTFRLGYLYACRPRLYAAWATVAASRCQDDQVSQLLLRKQTQAAGPSEATDCSAGVTWQRCWLVEHSVHQVGHQQLLLQRPLQPRSVLSCLLPWRLSSPGAHPPRSTCTRQQLWSVCIDATRGAGWLQSHRTTPRCPRNCILSCLPPDQRSCVPVFKRQPSEVACHAGHAQGHILQPRARSMTKKTICLAASAPHLPSCHALPH